MLRICSAVAFYMVDVLCYLHSLYIQMEGYYFCEIEL